MKDKRKMSVVRTFRLFCSKLYINDIDKIHITHIHTMIDFMMQVIIYKVFDELRNLQRKYIIHLASFHQSGYSC